MPVLEKTLPELVSQIVKDNENFDYVSQEVSRVSEELKGKLADKQEGQTIRDRLLHFQHKIYFARKHVGRVSVQLIGLRDQQIRHLHAYNKNQIRKSELYQIQQSIKESGEKLMMHLSDKLKTSFGLLIDAVHAHQSLPWDFQDQLLQKSLFKKFVRYVLSTSTFDLTASLFERKGATLLHLAIAYGYTKEALKLIDTMDVIHLDQEILQATHMRVVNPMVDPCRYWATATPLQLAVKHKNRVIIERLLDKGVDINHMSNGHFEKTTALSIAGSRSVHDREIYDLLRERGALTRKTLLKQQKTQPMIGIFAPLASKRVAVEVGTENMESNPIETIVFGKL